MSRDESRRSKRCRVDRDYDMGPGSGILVNDYDDERTLDEEEELEPSEDTHNELSDLQKESDIPIKDLLEMYGYGDMSCQDPNKAENENDDEEEDEDEDDDDDDDEDDDDPTDDLQQFYTKKYKDEKNGADIKAPSKDGDSTKTDDVINLASGIGSTIPNLEPKSEVDAGAVNALLSANPNANLDSSMNVDTANSDPSSGTIGGGGGGTSRLLRSVSRPQSEEEEDDCDYSPDEEEWKKTIMVGSDYQAAIPEGLCKYDDALPYENEDKMLWDPLHIKEEDVKEFLEKAQFPAVKGASLPSGRHLRDDEQALYLLFQCGYNVEEALRRRRMNVVPPSEPAASLWSEEECHNFEAGLRTYGKDFHLIQKNKVRTRSVGELVQFYYLWKKTERHDIFTYKARLEKKKYALHPGITDYMDRFLEEQEGVRDRSSSPNVHGLLYGDSKRQRMNTNSINNEDQVLELSNNPSAPTTTSASSCNTTTATSGGKGVDSSAASTLVNSGLNADPLTVEHHHSSLSSPAEPVMNTPPAVVATANAVSSLTLPTATIQQQQLQQQQQQRQHHIHQQHLQQQPAGVHNHHVNNNNNDNEEVAARSPENILPHLPP